MSGVIIVVYESGTEGNESMSKREISNKDENVCWQESTEIDMLLIIHMNIL